MRSVTAGPRPAAKQGPRPAVKPADPAPSRWRYRMQRLWLTPMFRMSIRTGLPLFVCVGLVAWYLSGDGRIEAIVDTYETTLSDIQGRPEFMVSLLRIEGASEQLQSDIEEALPIDLPLSQFQLDIDGLRKTLLELDPVLHADVRVLAGGILVLRITEREPAIVWRHADGIDVLDATGHRVATLDDLGAAGALPIVAGEGAGDRVVEALRLFEAAAPVTDRMVGLVRVGARRWDVVLTGDKRIALPEAAPAAALDRALAMHAAQGILDRDITLVDLRLPDRPVLRLSGPARDELRRLQDLERLSYSETQ